MSESPQPNGAKVFFEEKIARIHVLIIISSTRAGDLVKRLFESLGFTNLYVVADAAEGLQYLREIQLHLIVTDADLKVSRSIENHGVVPKGHDSIQLSGIQFVHRLRSSHSSPAPFIPVLMLMDHARSDEIFKARDAGVNEIVLKPLEAKNFCERIIDLVDKPRVFITATSYRGPCRRRKASKPFKAKERRTREVRLIRCDEKRGVRA